MASSGDMQAAAAAAAARKGGAKDGTGMQRRVSETLGASSAQTPESGGGPALTDMAGGEDGEGGEDTEWDTPDVPREDWEMAKGEAEQ